jgi:Mrp family chromosome partitioning ATPase/capsular polysaccharide biosynthesis protein
VNNHQTDVTLVQSVTTAIRRHLVFVVASTLVITGGAAAFTLRHPARYASSASVLIRPLPGNALSAGSVASSQQIMVAMETEAGIVNSPAVTGIVSKRLQQDVIAGSAAVSAAVPPNTEIVRITYRAASADAARSGAQAFAEGFLQYRTTQAEATQRFQLRRMQRQAATAAANLRAASRAASSTNPPPDSAARVQLDTSLLSTLQANIGQLQVQNFDAGTIVTPATAATSASGLRPILLIVAGLLLGVGIGVGGALWRERRGRTDGVVPAALQDSAWATSDHASSEQGFSEHAASTQAAGHPSPAILPTLVTLPSAVSQSTSLLDEGRVSDPLYDAYHRARAVVLTRLSRPCVLAVADLDDEHRGATVVANLGLILAQGGYRVSLVDATSRGNGVGRLFGVEHTCGLSDVLATGQPASVGITRLRGLAVMSSGTELATSTQWFTTARFSRVVAQLRDQSDYVVVAAPPPSSRVWETVATASDNLVFVVDGMTSQRDLGDVVDRCDRLALDVVGAIVVPGGARARSRRGKEAGDSVLDVRLGAMRSRAWRGSTTVSPTGDEPSEARQSAGAGRHVR